MRKIFAFAVLFCATALSACDNTTDDIQNPSLSKIETLLNAQTTEPDFSAFLQTMQNGVWIPNDLCLFYTNGEIEDGNWTGGSHIHDMMLLPNGECRVFWWADYNPRIPMLYLAHEWNICTSQPNSIELYSKEYDEEMQNPDIPHADFYAPRTTMELLYYKDGVFVMKGMQPIVYSSSDAYQGIYMDYFLIHGHIDTSPETVAKYLTYEHYEEYKEQHPEMF